MTARLANITLLRLHAVYQKYTANGVRRIVCNEGGTRSAKTWDTLYFLIWYCRRHAGERKRIRVFRETLVSCRESVWQDFITILNNEGLFDRSMCTESPKPKYRLFGNTLYFMGLDDWTKVEGLPSDVLFFNEALEIDKRCFESLLMRCSELCVLDWNPRYTSHWCFDLEKRTDVLFFHSTYKDNHYLPRAICEGIEAFEPTAENIERGTANEWRWKVYGLGVRAAMEGLVYPDVHWIGSFPDDCEYVTLGMDFGFTNDPTALVRCGMTGNDLYVELLYYRPTEQAETLYENIKQYFVGANGAELYAICDSADKYAKNPEGMVTALQARGLKCIKARKYAGSIVDGIAAVKAFRLHIVENRNARNEQEAYCFATVNGILVNTPIDSANHFWDALRYVVQGEFAYRLAIFNKKEEN